MKLEHNLGTKEMKIYFVFLIVILLLSGLFFFFLMQQKQNHQKLESEYESLQQRIAPLEIQPQTGQNDDKTKLATRLAKANKKLIDSDFSKFESELRDSNYEWLWSWTTFFGTIVAIVVTIIGFALWFSVKSIIEDRVEKHLSGFKKAVEQVKKQQERIRIIERDYAVLMLAVPDEYDYDDEEYVYPETVKSLSEQTVLDVIYHKGSSIYVRIRAAEILKKKNSERSLSVLLKMVNSILDTDIIKDEDTESMWHLRDLVPLFKDLHDEKTFRGLSKLLARVLKLKEDTDIRKAHLYWIVFSLSYVSDALNTDRVIPKMRDALHNLYVSDKEDSNNLENLVNYFNKFQEHEGIKKILTNSLTDNLPDVETQCLELLQKHDPNFVKEWKEQKAATNTENEESP